MDHTPGFLKMVNEAKGRIQEVTVDDVLKKLEQKTDFIFIDVREDDEWKSGSAKGSIHIGKGVLERDIESKIPDKHKELILYCGGGFRSALAADSLQKMGYTRVFSMDGGIRLWRERRLPEQKD